MGLGTGVVDAAEDQIDEEEDGDVKGLADRRCISQKPGERTGLESSDQGWIDKVWLECIQYACHVWKTGKERKEDGDSKADCDNYETDISLIRNFSSV